MTPTRPTPSASDNESMSSPNHYGNEIPEPRRMPLPRAEDEEHEEEYIDEDMDETENDWEDEPETIIPPAKDNVFWTRPKLIALAVALVIFVYALWTFVSAQQQPEQPANVAPHSSAAPTPSASPSPTVAASSSYGSLSNGDRDAFLAQSQVEAFVTAYFNRGHLDSPASVLAGLKPFLTSAAYKKAEGEINRWTWKECAATACDLHGMILNMYPTPDLAVNETEYTVQIAMSDGTGATAVLLPQLVYRVHLYPTGDAKSPWVVDDYIRVLSISG